MHRPWARISEISVPALVRNLRVISRCGCGIFRDGRVFCAQNWWLEIHEQLERGGLAACYRVRWLAEGNYRCNHLILGSWSFRICYALRLYSDELQLVKSSKKGTDLQKIAGGIHIC